MRTNIDIDDVLLAEVMQKTGAKTKREAVDDALRAKVQQLLQSELRRFRCTLSHWDGDLEDMKRRRLNT